MARRWRATYGKGVSGGKKERGQGRAGSGREWGPGGVRDVGTRGSGQAGRGLAQPPPRREREAEMLGVPATRVSAAAGPTLSSKPVRAPHWGNWALGLGLSPCKKKRWFPGGPQSQRKAGTTICPFT